MKPTSVKTKQQLEALVARLDVQNKRAASKLVEVGEAPPAPAPATAAPSVASPAASPPKGSLAPPADQIEKPAEEASISVNTVVDQLNAIRGGQSFKEPKVMDELKRYFDGLEESEQEALHAYLKGLAQIVSGQIDAGAAEEPSDHGVDTKSTGKVTRTVKPNVTRKPGNPANAAPAKPAPVTRTAVPSSSEDTTPPAPIVPKKR